MAATHGRRAALRRAWRQWRPRRAAALGLVRLFSAARWGFERWAAAWRHQRATVTAGDAASAGGSGRRREPQAEEANDCCPAHRGGCRK